MMLPLMINSNDPRCDRNESDDDGKIYRIVQRTVPDNIVR